MFLSKLIESIYVLAKEAVYSKVPILEVNKQI